MTTEEQAYQMALQCWRDHTSYQSLLYGIRDLVLQVERDTVDRVVAAVMKAADGLDDAGCPEAVSWVDCAREIDGAIRRDFGLEEEEAPVA